MKSYLLNAVLLLSLVSVANCNDFGKPYNSAKVNGPSSNHKRPPRPKTTRPPEPQREGPAQQSAEQVVIPPCTSEYFRDFLSWNKVETLLAENISANETPDEKLVAEASGLCKKLFDDRPAIGCEAVSGHGGKLNRFLIRPSDYKETCASIENTLVKVK